VRQALERRTDRLIEEEFARRRSREILFTSDLLGRLERRELVEAAHVIDDETGLKYRAINNGEQVSGVYRRREALASGRFALIIDEASREFGLVPWRPEIERALGQEVSAIVRGRSVEWSFPPNRDLSI
jgi:hypothetical protein